MPEWTPICIDCDRVLTPIDQDYDSEYGWSTIYDKCVCEN
jgi:hypothetical protein